MRKLASFLFLALVLLALPGSAQQPATPPVADAVAKVQAFYDKTSTYSATFNQEYMVKAYNTTKKSTGKVTFAKPGKMDWVYADPVGNRIVSDGSTLRVFTAADKQMYEQTVTQSQYPAALSFLTGQGKLADLFNFTLFDGAAVGFPGGYVLAGDPKNPTAAYTKVLFYVDSASSQVLRVLILDGQQNRNRFDFTNPQVNLPVPPTQFVFSPPPGTTVVHP